MDLTIILVNYNTATLLPLAIATVRKATTDIPHKIVIVDNASRDDSVSVLHRDFADCQVLFNDANAGFGRANNQAIPFIQGRYVLLLNTDAFVSLDTIQKTLAYMDEHPRAGILGVKLVSRDGSLQPSCRYFPTPWNLFLQRSGLSRWFPWVRLMDDMAWNHATPRQCDWVPGCYYLVRRQVIDQVGLFDPRYFLYYEEIDHCLRAKKAGWDVHYFPDTTVVHIGGESAKSDGEITASGRQLAALQIESELLYFRKNHGPLSAWLNVALLVFSDLIQPIKRWIKGKRPVGWKQYMRHTALVWSLFKETHWAARPTR